MSRQSKKDRFKGQDKKGSDNNKVFIGALLAGVVIIAGIFLFALNDDEVSSPYDDRVVQQSVVNYEMEDGKIYVDESELDSKEFIIFNVDLNEPIVTSSEHEYLPVTAVRRADGELVAAIGLCEPCGSERMRIEGNNLVCNSCKTVWALDTFKGLSGGCMDFPPVEIAVEITDGKLVFNEGEIQNFEPRPL